MPTPLRLEVFERPDVPDAPTLMLPEDVEDLRMTAYERGYVAGWDDAFRQTGIEAQARQAQVAARIEALTFGYHEARAHVLTALAPLIEAMVATLLPAVARGAVLPLTLEQLMPLAVTHAARPLVLRVPPGWAGDYQAALEGLVLPPLRIIEGPDLAETEAEIAPAAADDADLIRVDLTQALAAIGAALAAFHPAASTSESLRA